MDFEADLDLVEGEEALDNPSPWLIGGLVVAAGLAYYWYSSSSVATEAVAAPEKPLEKTQDQKEVAAIKKWLRKFRPGAPAGFAKPMYKLNKVESRVIEDEDTTYYFGQKSIQARKDQDVIYQLKLDFTDSYLEETKKQPTEPTEFFVLVTPDLQVKPLGATLKVEAPRATGKQTIIRGGRGERTSGPGNQYTVPVGTSPDEIDVEYLDSPKLSLLDAAMEAASQRLAAMSDDSDDDEPVMTGLELTRANRSHRSRHNGLIAMPSEDQMSAIRVPAMIAGGAIALVGLGAAAYLFNRNR